MKILKETGNYLKTRARLRLLLVVPCIVVCIMLLLSAFQWSPLYVDVGDWGVPRSVFMVVPLFMSWYWWREYTNYKKGFEGEVMVAELLKLGLPDDFYLINDVKIKDVNGRVRNIDHVVLSPRGIFVIETKNWKGKITAVEDRWSTTIGNPSRQTQKNALFIKKVIESLEHFKSMRIWVEPIVVFANSDIELDVRNMAVKVAKLNELLYCLITFEGNNNYLTDFSTEELDLIGEEILRQTS
jgi:hypothetical protein